VSSRPSRSFDGARWDHRALAVLAALLALTGLLQLIRGIFDSDRWWLDRGFAASAGVAMLAFAYYVLSRARLRRDAPPANDAAKR